MRLIDADALTKKWQDVLDSNAADKGTAAYVAFELFIDRVAAEPTVQVKAVPRSYWECYETSTSRRRKGDEYTRLVARKVFHCRRCCTDSPVRYNYCPNCGARMDGQ